MKLLRILRSSVFLFLTMLLGLGVGLHSAGIALTRKAPEVALWLFPLNGLAQEKRASSAFLAVALHGEAASVDTQVIRGWAKSAYRDEPLTPEAHAILAFAEENGERRSSILKVAAKLNRRNSRLQAAVLQDQVKQNDYSGAIGTLDRILRVNPSRTSELIPTLLPVFMREGAVDEFARIVDGSSPWHEAFYRYALREPDALTNLLELRRRISFGSQELDRTLLGNLISHGKVDSAYEFYESLTRKSQRRSSSGKIGWTSRYPPFDWDYTDQPGLRAQSSLSGGSLEITVKPGQGGVVARRIMKTPEGPFIFEVTHRIGSSRAVRDIDIAIRCIRANGAVLLDRDLASQGDGFRIASPPESCKFIEATIEARAWSGRSALDVEIEALRIRK